MNASADEREEHAYTRQYKKMTHIKAIIDEVRKCPHCRKNRKLQEAVNKVLQDVFNGEKS